MVPFSCGKVVMGTSLSWRKTEGNRRVIPSSESTTHSFFAVSRCTPLTGTYQTALANGAFSRRARLPETHFSFGSTLHSNLFGGLLISSSDFLSRLFP